MMGRFSYLSDDQAEACFEENKSLIIELLGELNDGVFKSHGKITYNPPRYQGFYSTSPPTLPSPIVVLVLNNGFIAVRPFTASTCQIVVEDQTGNCRWRSYGSTYSEKSLVLNLGLATAVLRR